MCQIQIFLHPISRISLSTLLQRIRAVAPWTWWNACDILSDALLFQRFAHECQTSSFGPQKRNTRNFWASAWADLESAQRFVRWWTVLGHRNLKQFYNQLKRHKCLSRKNRHILCTLERQLEADPTNFNFYSRILFKIKSAQKHKTVSKFIFSQLEIHSLTTLRVRDSSNLMFIWPCVPLIKQLKTIYFSAPV